ncbi:MAG: hypothetical protein QUS11_06640 [Candidatus Fermentibacter sp.]|nr:hypothetical protein [Candidatus Fermentibacter sp.]
MTRRFLTPEEAAALQTPAVQAVIDRINQNIANGLYTTGYVHLPLWEAVKAGLEASGWEVVIDEGSIRFRDCRIGRLIPVGSASDSDAEVAGAVLLGLRGPGRGG